MTRAKQAASARELGERRAEIVAALADVAELEFVNGGGTGSIATTAEQWAVTEIAAGSGFHAPIRLDHYRGFRLRPAAMLVLPASRGARADSTGLAGARRTLPAAGTRLEVGDRVYFRDLEAGTLCERFNRLFVVTGTTIRDEVPTYRGEGKTFL